MAPLPGRPRAAGAGWVTVGAPSQPDVDIVLERPLAVDCGKSIRHPIHEEAVADATAVYP
jgi:hypothetical protein